MSCKITLSIEEHIVQELLALFGEDYHQVSLAVRSSAAGKDHNNPKFSNKQFGKLSRPQCLHCLLFCLKGFEE